MRKSLWIFPILLLFAAIGAPYAQADSFAATFNCVPAGTCTSTATTPDVMFPTPAITVTWDSFTFALPALSASDAPGDAYTWSAVILRGNTQFVIDDLNTFDQVFSFTLGNANPFLALQDQGTLIFTPVVTPEPSSVALMLVGVGLVLVMRKRIAQGLPQST